VSGRQSGDKVVVSVAWTTAQPVAQAFTDLGPQVLVLRRSSDWAKGRFARLLLLIRSTSRAVRAARAAEKLVLLTVGYDVFVAVVLLRLHRAASRPRLVVADFLLPTSRRLSTVQGWLLRQVDEWVCIRSGDIATLETMFGVDRNRCVWVPFPLGADPDELDAIPGGDLGSLTGGYVYSAGTAHRDWTLVLDALQLVGCRAVLAVDPSHPELQRPLPANVSVVGKVSPQDGRRLAACADVVVVALRDTHLPAGPIVLTDALALGKALVATDVNGARDYVVDGVTGVLVPPGAPEALAEALRRLLGDAKVRTALGSRGRSWTREHLQPADFARAVLAEK